MRKYFVAGNWKMNGSAADCVSLAKGVAEQAPQHAGVDVLVAPPFPYLFPVREAIAGTHILLGAQDCHEEASGAFTGDVAAGMVRDAGCSHVILGHSERRQGLGETDDRINAKVRKALEEQLRVILCIGETLDERKSDRTETVLETQLSGSLAGIESEQMPQLTIAYEPVWAIGTGEVATTEQAQSAHAFVRSWIGSSYSTAIAEGMVIQYGGSVKPDNAADLLGQADVDGALVGGASLKADSFAAIVAAATEHAS